MTGVQTCALPIFSDAVILFDGLTHRKDEAEDQGDGPAGDRRVLSASGQRGDRREYRSGGDSLRWSDASVPADADVDVHGSTIVRSARRLQLK